MDKKQLGLQNRLKLLIPDLGTTLSAVEVRGKEVGCAHVNSQYAHPLLGGHNDKPAFLVCRRHLAKKDAILWV